MALLTATTVAVASPFIDDNSIRGGASSVSSRPTFLELDRNDLPKYMDKAKERHREAIESAQESYWSGDSSIADDGSVSEIDAIKVETLQVNPPDTWALPDFADEFSNEIKVTFGAGGGPDGEPSTPLFTPDECQQMIDAAEKHFEGREWTTLPSGQYDVAGFWIKSVPACHSWFNKMIQNRLFPLLKREFPQFATSIAQLVVDNAYVFKVSAWLPMAA